MVPSNTILKNTYISKFLIFLFTILIVFLIPFRDLYKYDMVIYYQIFHSLSNLSLIDAFRLSEWEPLFLITQWVISRFTDELVPYIVSMFLLYVFIFNKALKNIFSPWQQVFVYFAFLNFTFFYDYTFNGARQGFSIMFLILMISLLIQEKPKKMNIYLAGLFAILFHYSAAPVVLFLALFRKLQNSLKYALTTWFACAFLSITGLNSLLQNIGFISKIGYIEIYTDPGMAKHFDGINRIDFLIFSAFFLFLSIFLYKYFSLEENKKTIYLKLINIYAYLNAYFLLFGFISFSSRLAMYSWFLIPILIYYPVLNNKKFSTIGCVLLSILALVIGFLTSAQDVIFIRPSEF